MHEGTDETKTQIFKIIGLGNTINEQVDEWWRRSNGKTWEKYLDWVEGEENKNEHEITDT